MICNYIRTTHELANELLRNPDTFITATIRESNREYMIESIQKKASCANADDTSVYLTLNLNDYGHKI